MFNRLGSSSIVYPLFLLFFIFFVFYVFFFGDNGVFIHEDKVEELRSLRSSNKELYDKFFALNEKVISLRDNSPYHLENEARRRMSLKKEGDIIIILRNRALIDEIKERYEEDYEGSFYIDEEELLTERAYAGSNQVVILGLILNVVIAFVLTLVFAVFRK